MTNILKTTRKFGFWMALTFMMPAIIGGLNVVSASTGDDKILEELEAHEISQEDLEKEYEENTLQELETIEEIELIYKYLVFNSEERIIEIDNTESANNYEIELIEKYQTIFEGFERSKEENQITVDENGRYWNVELDSQYVIQNGYNDFNIEGFSRNISVKYVCGVSWGGLKWCTKTSNIFIPTGYEIKLDSMLSIILGGIAFGLMMGSGTGLFMSVSKFTVGLNAKVLIAKFGVNTVLGKIGGIAIDIKVLYNTALAIVVGGTAIKTAMAFTGLGAPAALIAQVILLVGSTLIFHLLGSNFLAKGALSLFNSSRKGVKVDTNLVFLNQKWNYQY